MLNKLPQLTEHDVQNSIIELLKYKKFLVWRNNVGAAKFEHKGVSRWVRFSQSGHSDIFAVQPKTGVFIALEVKHPARRNTATPEQKQFIEDVKSKGGIASVVCSTEEVSALLNL